MGPVRREVFTRFREGRPVFPGFVSYVRRAMPVLLHRSGWVDGADAYDDFADSLSHDNGASWSVPRPSMKSRETPAGRLRYAEGACFFDADREKLLAFTSRVLCLSDWFDPSWPWEVVEDEYAPTLGAWRGERAIGVGLPGGLAIGSCFPVLTSRGTLLVPAYSPISGGNGRRQYQALLIRGSRGEDGNFSFSLGHPARIDPGLSSGGLSEAAVAELKDGRIVIVCRGDNSQTPERSGHKWVCFSSDEGKSWSVPQPLGCDGGEPLESGSSGSALIRSVRSGRLYWIGNLCVRGSHAHGAEPLSPLVLAEVREEPFALKRSSFLVVDEQTPGEPETVQLSRFRFYQDRLSGELVLFLTRFAERCASDWMQADYYRYRVPLD